MGCEILPTWLISARDWQLKVALTGFWLGKAGVIRRLVLLEWLLWPIWMAIPDGILGEVRFGWQSFAEMQYVGP